MPSNQTIQNHAAFIWSVADLLRGDYKQSEYGKVILPLTLLRRLDCVLERTKQAVLDRHAQLGGKVENIDPVLERAAGEQFFNTSKYDFGKLIDAPEDLADNLRHYIASFSTGARDVLDKFEFDTQIARLARANLLYLVVSKFADVDLHPDKVSNIEMGYLYEELIRRFSELSNETAGEHFTPREVIRLMVNLLFIEDDELLTKPGVAKTMLDPACGTGGMLSVAEDHLRSLNPHAKLKVYGQELNAETYAICRSDMMLKGQDASQIVYGNSFSEDGHQGGHFDYLLANPPFGVEWRKVADIVRDEADKKGFAGRFGAGLPRINDGSFLFLQHMISKMKPVDQGGSRLAIVFNGSPLFTGAAGSGESEIRRWIIENDWLEAVVALPDQLFYNTGISTYFWIVTNRKHPDRKGKVQLVDAREMFVKMRKSLGEKRKEISQAQIDEITRLYGDFAEGDRVKIFPNESFGFMRITVERPLRLRWEISDETLAAVETDNKVAKLSLPDRAALLNALRDGPHRLDEVSASKLAWNALTAAGQQGKPLHAAVVNALAVRDPDADPITDRKGNAEPDPDLRDNENVPLPPDRVTFEADVTARLAMRSYRVAVDDYMTAEVLPYVQDAWVDHDKTKVGYEIPLTRHFYVYVPPRPLAEIDSEIKALESEIQALLAEVTEVNWRPLRHVATVRVSNVDKKSAEGEVPVRLVNYTDVYYGDRLGPHLALMEATATADQVTQFGLQPNDVVITKDSETADDIGVAAFVESSAPELVCGYHLAVLRPRQDLVDGRFLYWSLVGDNARGQLATAATGVTRFGLRQESIRGLGVWTPELARQRQLAQYLDTETARIDALITRRLRMVELLDERLGVVIRSTLRSSGGVVPLKRRWTVTDCKHRTPMYVESGYPVASPGDISPGRIDLSAARRFVDEEDYQDLADEPRRPRRGDIIYSRNASIGIAAYVDNDEKFCMGQDVCRISSSDQNQLFLTYVLNTLGVDQLEVQKIGSTFSRVNVAQIQELLVPAPHPAEQEVFARRLDDLQTRHDQVISALNSQVDLLQEHRQALITAAVTGELEIPGVAA